MKITFASGALFVWGLIVLSSLAGALLACAKAGWRGWPVPVRLLPGALLLFGFVSAIIGLYEINDYALSAAFWISIGVGIGGVVLLGSGVRALRRMFERMAE